MMLVESHDKYRFLFLASKKRYILLYSYTISDLAVSIKLLYRTQRVFDCWVICDGQYKSKLILSLIPHCLVPDT